MLTALEDGVKGAKWSSLMDKVYAQRNLRRANDHSLPCFIADVNRTLCGWGAS